MGIDDWAWDIMICGIGVGMIDVALVGRNNGAVDAVNYNIRSMSTHGSYTGPQGQWCKIDFGGTTYFAIRFSSSAGSMWGTSPQHCSFNGFINNCYWRIDETN